MTTRYLSLGEIHTLLLALRAYAKNPKATGADRARARRLHDLYQNQRTSDVTVQIDDGESR